jgi:transcriptional regulator with GAF, ATPase, and Fis domain
LIAQGRFRQDLYFRLKVVQRTIKPLRERRCDINLLADQFAEMMRRKHGLESVDITPTACAALSRYHWPGNARELRNAIEAASDDDGWAPLGSVGHIITNQQPDFDSRNYGYAKLSDLIVATTLFELDRRSPGDGKPGIVYARDKRRRSGKPGRTSSTR